MWGDSCRGMLILNGWVRSKAVHGFFFGISFSILCVKITMALAEVYNVGKLCKSRGGNEAKK